MRGGAPAPGCACTRVGTRPVEAVRLQGRSLRALQLRPKFGQCQQPAHALRLVAAAQRKVGQARPKSAPSFPCASQKWMRHDRDVNYLAISIALGYRRHQYPLSTWQQAACAARSEARRIPQEREADAGGLWARQRGRCSDCSGQGGRYCPDHCGGAGGRRTVIAGHLQPA
jgi:hypothetical protein